MPQIVSKIITIEVLDKPPDEGGVNITTKDEVDALKEITSNFPNRVHRNYWILILAKDRVIETPKEFMDRLKGQIKKYNDELPKNEIVKERPKVSYVG